MIESIVKDGGPLIVGFSGRAGAGKDTAAAGLFEAFGTGAATLPFWWARRSIAQSLKDLAADEFGWDGAKDERGRRLLQGIGQAARDYDPEFWLRKVELRQRFDDGPKLAGRANMGPWVSVITDLRYYNEAAYFHDLAQKTGGEFLEIHIERLSLGPATDSHPSENELALPVSKRAVSPAWPVEELWNGNEDSVLDKGEFQGIVRRKVRQFFVEAGVL